MKLRFIYLFLIVLVTSCYKIERPEKPKHFITKDKMIAILVDISLINSAKSVNKKVIEKNGIIPDEYIYKTHGIDSVIFAENNEYYAYKISEYQDIYTKVKDSLDKLKKKYKAIEAIEKAKKAKKDSIKKAGKIKSKPEKLQKIKDINKIKSSNKNEDNKHEEM